MLKNGHDNSGSRKVCLGMERRKKQHREWIFPKVNHNLDMISVAILGKPSIGRCKLMV